MGTSTLLVSILVVVAFSSAILTNASPAMPDKLQHPEDKSQRAEKEPEANQHRKILEFLSAFDEVQRSTNSRLVPKTTGVQAYTKTLGKTIKMEGLDDGQSRSFSHQDGVAELSKDLLAKYPFSGKHFRKAAPLAPKKSKKRACFWKYCVQSK